MVSNDRRNLLASVEKSKIFSYQVALNLQALDPSDFGLPVMIKTASTVVFEFVSHSEDLQKLQDPVEANGHSLPSHLGFSHVYLTIF